MRTYVAHLTVFSDLELGNSREGGKVIIWQVLCGSTRLGNLSFVLIILIGMLALSMPLKAGQKMWSCEMISFAMVDELGVVEHEPEKFQMRAGPAEVSFVNEKSYHERGFLDPLKLPITYWKNASHWTAEKVSSTISFSNGTFTFSEHSYSKVIAISAQCHDF